MKHQPQQHHQELLLIDRVLVGEEGSIMIVLYLEDPVLVEEGSIMIVLYLEDLVLVEEEPEKRVLLLLLRLLMVLLLLRPFQRLEVEVLYVVYLPFLMLCLV